MLATCIGWSASRAMTGNSSAYVLLASAVQPEAKSERADLRLGKHRKPRSLSNLP